MVDAKTNAADAQGKLPLSLPIRNYLSARLVPVLMRLFLLSLCILLSCFSAESQTVSLFDREGAEYRTFYGGLAVGANFTQVDGDGYSGYNKVGVYAAPLVYVRLSRLLFGAVSIGFSQKGTKARVIRESPYTGPTPEGYDLKLNYAEVSAGLYYRIAAKPRAAIGAGLLYGRLISSKEEAFTNGPVNLRPDVNFFRKDDIGGWLEPTWEWSQGWLIGLRYSYSLRSIREAQRIPQYYGGGFFPGQWNNVFTLRITCFFGGRDKEG